ncbi:hypothetical protein Sjap_006940 [Stephania japonica]|uniref:WRC domain-containing protein n=1 Tax=Stephania japonica TaxID=461633 RepID=A0AAP0PK80_9MAGN
MEESSSSYSVITPEEVLESLMNDGTIDAIRLKIINQLKANEELKNTTNSMVEQSKVLNTPGAEKQTKRELFDALRQELESPVLEMASKSVWELILDGNGIGKEIYESVEKVFCRLSGREPPLYPPSIESQPEQEKRKEKKNLDKEKENGSPSLLPRKRNFSKMSKRREESEVIDRSNDPASVTEDSGSGRRVSGSGLDSEPGRCKRTDGKSWRCFNNAIPDQKYCEKHTYRGKSRPKKQVKTTSKADALKDTDITDMDVSNSSPHQPESDDHGDINRQNDTVGHDHSGVSPRSGSSLKSTA